ncbi:spermidine synthase [Cumulibacter manganitolerans]|uniref:spermidine synthase n=1 Tax=Cumulibacter manganitolerans TaxID=1884992 RepID=UPI001885AD12|nr:fused MFS/spermidine synthase [Cumulibacter manganitolerans]
MVSSRKDRPLTWLPADRARALRFVPAEPVPGDFTTDHAQVQVAMDADRAHGWLVLLDDVLASYVALDDPRHLEFEYTRWIADLIDGLPPGPIDALHLGGAACSLPVYVETTRPGSRQVVVDFDAALLDLMRSQFGIRSSRRFSLRAMDALEALRAAPDGSMDVIVRDTFSGDRTPEHLRGRELADEVARVLRPGGVYLANIGDRPGLAMTRELLAHSRQALGLHASDAHNGRMAIICDPAVLRGRRYGNVVAALSRTDLPLEGWLDAARRAAFPARVTHGERLWAYL